MIVRNRTENQNRQVQCSHDYFYLLESKGNISEETKYLLKMFNFKLNILIKLLSVSLFVFLSVIEAPQIT